MTENCDHCSVYNFLCSVYVMTLKYFGIFEQVFRVRHTKCIKDPVPSICTEYLLNSVL